MVHLNEIHWILRIQSFYEVAMMVGERWCLHRHNQAVQEDYPTLKITAIRSLKTSETDGTTSQKT
jgi:hypothetical protein